MSPSVAPLTYVRYGTSTVSPRRTCTATEEGQPLAPAACVRSCSHTASRDGGTTDGSGLNRYSCTAGYHSRAGDLPAVSAVDGMQSLVNHAGAWVPEQERKQPQQRTLTGVCTLR